MPHNAIWRDSIPPHESHHQTDNYGMFYETSAEGRVERRGSRRPVVEGDALRESKRNEE